MGRSVRLEQRGVITAWQAWIFLLLALIVARAWPQSTPPAQEIPGKITLNIDVSQSKVHWTLGSTLHTVHGTFSLKRGAVSLDPQSGKASGEVAVYATSGESGNDSRDKKMHTEILESTRYPEVVFRPDRIKGSVPAQGACNVEMHGMLALHGSEHEVTVPVQAEISGDHWKGEAKFSVPYVQWGLKSPNTFFLKADPVVQIQLELSGTVQQAATP